jgi:redox-sensitive bicupin YhaK (pirin superfamily)
MLTIYPFKKLGKVDHGWLQARHHFSFASYYDPQRMSFGVLRVINDDIIKPNRGFPRHPHDNMEIITYVRSGAITHKDTKGNYGVTSAGDIQVMSAGSGIEHSEYNLEDKNTNLYQIWISPNKHNVNPRWEQKTFPKHYIKDSLPLLVSGNKSDSNALFIYQDAQLYGGNLAKDTSILHRIKHQAYILVSKGKARVNADLLCTGDGAKVVNEPQIKITALEDTEILIIDVPVQ